MEALSARKSNRQKLVSVQKQNQKKRSKKRKLNSTETFYLQKAAKKFGR